MSCPGQPSQLLPSQIRRRRSSSAPSRTSLSRQLEKALADPNYEVGRGRRKSSILAEFESSSSSGCSSVNSIGIYDNPNETLDSSSDDSFKNEWTPSDDGSGSVSNHSYDDVRVSVIETNEEPRNQRTRRSSSSAGGSLYHRSRRRRNYYDDYHNSSNTMKHMAGQAAKGFGQGLALGLVGAQHMGNHGNGHLGHHHKSFFDEDSEENYQNNRVRFSDFDESKEFNKNYPPENIKNRKSKLKKQAPSPPHKRNSQTSPTPRRKAPAPPSRKSAIKKSPPNVRSSLTSPRTKKPVNKGLSDLDKKKGIPPPPPIDGLKPKSGTTRRSRSAASGIPPPPPMDGLKTSNRKSKSSIPPPPPMTGLNKRNSRLQSPRGRSSRPSPRKSVGNPNAQSRIPGGPSKQFNRPAGARNSISPRHRRLSVF